MLEILNGFLLVYFLALSAFSALIPNFIKPIVACFTRPSRIERTIWDEILRLKTQQKTICMKDEFAAYSKLQRKINKLESELKDHTQTRMSKSIAIKSSIQIVFQVIVTLVMVASVFWFRREPVVSLKGNLFPLTTIMRYPSDMPNAISTHIWALISNISIKILLKPVTS